MSDPTSPSVAEIREARRILHQVETAKVPHYVFSCASCGRQILEKKDPGLGSFDAPRHHPVYCCDHRAEFVRDGVPDSTQHENAT